MKKLLVIAMSLGLLLTMASCGADDSVEAAGKADISDTTITEETEVSETTEDTTVETTTTAEVTTTTAEATTEATTTAATTTPAPVTTTAAPVVVTTTVAAVTATAAPVTTTAAPITTTVAPVTKTTAASKISYKIQNLNITVPGDFELGSNESEFFSGYVFPVTMSVETIKYDEIGYSIQDVNTAITKIIKQRCYGEPNVVDSFTTTYLGKDAAELLIYDDFASTKKYYKCYTLIYNDDYYLFTYRYYDFSKDYVEDTINSITYSFS